MEVKIPSQLPDFASKSRDNTDNIDDENWEVYSSSDEDGPDLKKEWEPAPARIVELFTQISNGQLPELSWKCPGRREPSVEGDYEDDIDENEMMEEEVEKPTEFDFDTMSSEPSLPYGQRKTTGTLKVQQKRVARLDKILNDMKKDTSSFSLQSPKIPYQSSSRSDTAMPSSALFPSISPATAVKPEGTGIPLPSAYTLTSPPLLNSSMKSLDMSDESSDQLTRETTQDDSVKSEDSNL